MLVELVRTESNSDIYLDQLKYFPGKQQFGITDPLFNVPSLQPKFILGGYIIITFHANSSREKYERNFSVCPCRTVWTSLRLGIGNLWIKLQF